MCAAVPTPLKAVRRFLRRIVRGRPGAGAADVERWEYRFYIDRVREGMVVFDVGANVGELAVLFSRLAGASGTVHAFEASAGVFERLRGVCELVGRDNLVLNHVAVADSVGELELHVFDPAFSGWNSLADRPLRKYGIDIRPIGKERVPATTIDTYCAEHGIDHIDLLKLDIEGAEYQALLGARRMLHERRIDCCSFEFGQTTFDMGNTPAMIRAIFDECGYTLRSVVPGDPLFPGGADAATARFAIHIATLRG